MGKKVLKKFGQQKRFKDLQPGDPIFMLNPHDLYINETIVYEVKGWNDPRNLSGKAVVVTFYKPIVNIESKKSNGRNV